MRCRIATDPSKDIGRLVKFLIVNDYPYDWDPDTLAKCTIFRIENASGLPVGYVWIHWLNDRPGVAEFHACIERAYQGRWLFPSVSRLIFAFCELLGAKELIGRYPSPKIARSLEKIGFETIGDYSVKSFKQ